jgi:hypothetical protein
MHGRFSAGGLSNEENPLVFVNLDDHSYFHFISNDEPGVGHLDGLLPTVDSLFIADISPGGGFGGSSRNSGAIYQLQAVVPEPDSELAFLLAGGILFSMRRRFNVQLQRDRGA